MAVSDALVTYYPRSASEMHCYMTHQDKTCISTYYMVVSKNLATTRWYADAVEFAFLCYLMYPKKERKNTGVEGKRQYSAIVSRPGLVDD